MKKSINKTIKDIKSIKIQGARNIAKAALKAYYQIPDKNKQQAKQKLISARPTEPMLVNVLNKLDKIKNKKLVYQKILNHFDQAQDKINKLVFKLIKNNDIIFTHCHSTNVIKALIYSKNKGKKFQVYNTETRPLFQGRTTSSQLSKAQIPVTMFVDSAAAQAIKKTDKIFFGADALLKTGIINKIGSAMFAQIAKLNKKPVYIIADSWKYSDNPVSVEQRNFKEVWNNAPKKIKIKNPAFEFVNKKYIKAIITELGNLSYNKFLKKVKQ